MQRQNIWLFSTTAGIVLSSVIVMFLPCVWQVLNRRVTRDIEKMGFSFSQHVYGHCYACQYLSVGRTEKYLVS